MSCLLILIGTTHEHYHESVKIADEDLARVRGEREREREREREARAIKSYTHHLLTHRQRDSLLQTTLLRWP